MTLDASLGGIGGCPFAPAATGNIPTEDLLYMLQRCGYETGVSLEGAIETSKWLQQQLGRSVPGMLVKAGKFSASGIAAVVTTAVRAADQPGPSRIFR